MRGKTMETLLVIILLTSIGLFHSTNKPTKYALHMEDGTQTQIILHKNSQYACPLYCEADHMHQAIMCKDENQIEHNQYVYHISEKNEHGIAVYCSTKKILSMSRLNIQTSKDKLPDIASASSEE